MPWGLLGMTLSFDLWQHDNKTNTYSMTFWFPAGFFKRLNKRGSLTKIVTEGVRNLSGWQWKPYNSWRGVCHVLQSHLGQGTLVTTFKLLKWNVHHVRVFQTFKCPVRTTILTKFSKRRHDLDCRHYKTNCLNGMRFSEYRHWISLGALKKQIGSGWLVFLP